MKVKHFRILPLDRIIAKKAPKTEDMYGFIKTRRKISQKAMDRAIAEGFADDDSKSYGKNPASGSPF